MYAKDADSRDAQLNFLAAQASVKLGGLSKMTLAREIAEETAGKIIQTPDGKGPKKRDSSSTKKTPDTPTTDEKGKGKGKGKGKDTSQNTGGKGSSKKEEEMSYPEVSIGNILMLYDIIEAATKKEGFVVNPNCRKGRIVDTVNFLAKLRRWNLVCEGFSKFNMYEVGSISTYGYDYSKYSLVILDCDESEIFLLLKIVVQWKKFTIFRFYPDLMGHQDFFESLKYGDSVAYTFVFIQSPPTGTEDRAEMWLLLHPPAEVLECLLFKEPRGMNFAVFPNGSFFEKRYESISLVPLSRSLNLYEEVCNFKALFSILNVSHFFCLSLDTVL